MYHVISFTCSLVRRQTQAHYSIQRKKREISLLMLYYSCRLYSSARLCYYLLLLLLLLDCGHTRTDGIERKSIEHRNRQEERKKEKEQSQWQLDGSSSTSFSFPFLSFLDRPKQRNYLQQIYKFQQQQQRQQLLGYNYLFSASFSISDSPLLPRIQESNCAFGRARHGTAAEGAITSQIMLLVFISFRFLWPRAAAAGCWLLLITLFSRKALVQAVRLLLRPSVRLNLSVQHHFDLTLGVWELIIITRGKAVNQQTLPPKVSLVF